VIAQNWQKLISVFIEAVPSIHCKMSWELLCGNFSRNKVILPLPQGGLARILTVLWKQAQQEVRQHWFIV
jgi:hypothetical protein